MQYLMQLQNSQAKLNQNLTSNADIYSFDDLLITCAHEIMINGFETTVIPPTVKDWVAGKIVKSLPHRLIQKLLGFIIDNRDMTDTIAYKEKNHGEIPEFTLLLYRTAKAKVRKEKSNNIQPEPIDSNGTSTIFTDIDKPFFENNQNINEDGIKFFSDEIVVEQSQPVPSKNQDSVVTKNSLKTIYPTGA